MKRENLYAVVVTVLYLALGIIGILHHELWLDEAHHWLLARDSPTFAALVDNTRYEGHPILWNVLLYGLTRFTSDPLAMQLLHMGIAATAVFVFVRNAPFSWLFKTFFVFGYFMVFEYSIISRNYMLGVLFLFLACSIFKHRRHNFVLICVWLGFTANTHLVFLLISSAFFSLLLLDIFIERRIWERSAILGALLFLSALVLAIYQIIPPDDTRFFTRVDHIPIAGKFSKGFISFFKGLIAIPDFTVTGNHFWNTNLIVNHSKKWATVLGLLAYALPVVLFYRNGKILLFTYAALVGTQLFFFATQMSATRYDGMTYLILIVALWLDAVTKHDQLNWQPVSSRSYFDALKNPLLYGILGLQLASGMYAWHSDFKRPFSGSKRAVQYLEQSNLLDKTIIAAACEGTSVSAYAQKKIWFLCNGSYESFCRWDAGCVQPIDTGNILKLLDQFDAANHAVAVLNDKIPTIEKRGVWVQIDPHTKVKFHIAFKDNIVRQSNYYIYEILKTQ